MKNDNTALDDIERLYSLHVTSCKFLTSYIYIHKSKNYTGLKFFKETFASQIIRKIEKKSVV